MSSVVAAIGLVLSSIIPLGTAQAAAPPTGTIGIDVVKVNGTGCPSGTAAAAVSPDNTSFTVTYSQFLAQVGVGAKPGEFHQKCQLHLKVLNPPDYTYGIARVDHRGFASLASGATGVAKANYNFQGMPSKELTNHLFSGPFSDDWQATDVAEAGSIAHAPCGARQTFIIGTELRVDAGTSDPKKTTSFMSMDSTDSDLSVVYQLSWKKCA
jgi:hypothetical protein